MFHYVIGHSYQSLVYLFTFIKTRRLLLLLAIYLHYGEKNQGQNLEYLLHISLGKCYVYNVYSIAGNL